MKNAYRYLIILPAAVLALGLGGVLAQGIIAPTQPAVLTPASGVAPKLIGTSSAPSLSSCGTGALATGSNDIAGRVTVTGATACTVTFSTPYPIAAFCVVADVSDATKGIVSAQSISAFTINSLTSGDTVAYVCGGK